MESNLYAQLRRSCTLGRDMVSRPGSHANIAQFENTDISRDSVRDEHRSNERSASDCNQANSKSDIINKVGAFVERVTGIEPALSAWEASSKLGSPAPSFNNRARSRRSARPHGFPVLIR